MPGLLTLKTDLKSLKYGQDTPGGGSSREPYIVTDINTVDRGFDRLRLTKFDDGLIRGGVIGATNASVVDTLRIGKFFIDFPKGPLFVAKQVGLQLSNPKLESKQIPLLPTRGQGLFNNIINTVVNVASRIENAIGPTRIYNLGINTLAQVPVNAFGGHIVRHGILPKTEPDKYYEAVVTANNQNGTNRLYTLTNNFNLGPWGANKTGFTKKEQNILNKISSIFGANSNVTGLASIILNTNTETQIDQYLGGPGSVYGIGNTIIKRYSYTEDKGKIEFAKQQSKNFAGKTRDNNGNVAEVDYTRDLGNGPNAISNYSNSILTGSNDINKGVFNFSSIDPSTNFKSPAAKKYINIVSQIQQQQDPENINNAVFGSGSGNFATGYVNQFGIYKSYNDGTKIDNTKGHYQTNVYGTIGYKNSYGETVVFSKTFDNWNKISRENRVGSDRKDKINLTPIFREGSYYGADKALIDGDIRDLVKFRMQAVDTDYPTRGDWMVFRAYLTDLSDSVEASWSDVKYVGRGDRFYIYDGFTRKMSVSFKVAALSAEEMKPMYQKLNYLMSNLMPDYKGVLMRGPLMRMTIGNYIDSQLCKLDSLSYKVPQDSPWEIALDEPEGGTRQLILPHIIEVTLNFTPIGSETGRLSSTGTGSVRNEIPRKSQGVSHIAQNTTGADVAYLQYIVPPKGKILVEKPIALSEVTFGRQTPESAGF